MTHVPAIPVQPRNALEATVFAVELRQPPSPNAAQAIKAALDQFADELPGAQAAQPQGIFIAVGALPPFGEALRFAAKANGEHAWRVQITGQVLQVLCTEYTRFNEVWPRALKYLKAILRATDEGLAVGAISHQYVDRFHYTHTADAPGFRLDELFRDGSSYLTPKARQSGPEWHVHQGWFDHITPERRVLHQLNITNVLTHAPGQPLACMVDHRCMHQIANASHIAAQDLGAPDDGTLDAVMKELHAMHKTLLKELLQARKLQDIGMVD